MQFRQLDCILDDLTKAVAWFESVGIPTKETRLQAIHHYLFDQLQFPAPGATMPDYDHHMVISDAAAFFLIATEFSRLPSNLWMANYQIALNSGVSMSDTIPPCATSSSFSFM